MDSLKSKMKEMNLKEDLDRTSTVTNENVPRQQPQKSPGRLFSIFSFRKQNSS